MRVKIIKNSIISITLAIIFSACQNFEQPNILGPAPETDKTINAPENNFNSIDGINFYDNHEVRRISDVVHKKHFTKTTKNYIYDIDLNGYKGGTIQIANGNGSNFHVYDNSLTPPENIANGDTVAITMYITHDLSTNEMIFTFGPGGCKFSPSARIKLDYRLLSDEGDGIPSLYYINKGGQYELQEPDHIDFKKKFMTLHVDHFSRYAVAYGH